AEDGIRDRNVTGVQTCALPISTNIIEGLNRQYRKVSKTNSVFPSDTALEKMLFLASRNVTKKWTQRYRNWDQVLNQLILLYDERLTAYCKRKTGVDEKLFRSCLPLIPSAFIVFPENPSLFLRPGVGRAHEKGITDAVICAAKNLKIHV